MFMDLIGRSKFDVKFYMTNYKYTKIKTLLSSIEFALFREPSKVSIETGLI